MKHGRVYLDGGFRPAVVKEGPKWSQVVYMDGTHVKVKKVKGEIKVNPYRDSVTIKELARKMMCRTNCLGIKMNISKGAKAILQEARS